MTTQVYQDAILEHARHPRGQGALVPADADHEELNRLCGDEAHVYLRAEPGATVAIGFTSRGCALCRASASIMVELLTGKPKATVAAAATVFLASYETLTQGEPAVPAGTEPLYELRAFPTRARCVLLPWQALDAALRRMP